MRLCGISSRFQLLSPCMRQVTHALLTRPPLSLSSFRRNPKDFVRLACVRHAASVHPEPGSNSHVKKFCPRQYLNWLILDTTKIYCFKVFLWSNLFDLHKKCSSILMNSSSIQWNGLKSLCFSYLKSFVVNFVDHRIFQGLFTVQLSMSICCFQQLL